jgi:hypothetical protein
MAFDFSQQQGRPLLRGGERAHIKNNSSHLDSVISLNIKFSYALNKASLAWRNTETTPLFYNVC